MRLLTAQSQPMVLPYGAELEEAWRVDKVMPLRHALKEGFKAIWSQDGVKYLRHPNGECCLAINDIPFSFEDLDILDWALVLLDSKVQAILRKWKRLRKKAAQEDIEQIEDHIQACDDKIKSIVALRKQICHMKNLL